MRKVFLDELPRYKEGRYKDKINWRKCIGYKVTFIYDDIKSKVEIIDYIPLKQRLITEYKNEKYKYDTYVFSKCRLGRMLGKKTMGFKIKIGEQIKDEKRDMIIIDNKYCEKTHKGKVTKTKYYKYHCNKCGNEDWIMEYSLLGGNHMCNACLLKGCKKAVLGINTIWDTDRWMCDLGVFEEDAKKYTNQSHKKISVICPNCKKEKSIAINAIFNNKSISCTSCGDGKSYPEKFVFNMLSQLKINFKTEHSPKWIKPKRYDFYFRYNNEEFIIEVHGEQHYEDHTFEHLGGRTLKQEQQNDKYKRETALVNEIKYYIELDCRESNLEYVKNSILNSKLSNIFDLSKINWNKCEEYALKNIVREICEYWNNKKENETTTDLGRAFGLNNSTISKYLKQGVKLGWCSYNAREEMKINAIKASEYARNVNIKGVEIFKSDISLGIFRSITELSKQSEEIFGVKLLASSISHACNGRINMYKGYKIKYVE